MYAPLSLSSPLPLLTPTSLPSLPRCFDFVTTSHRSDSSATHHTPYKTEVVSSSETPRTSDAAPHSTIPGSSSTAAPPTSTTNTRPETETSAPPHPTSRTATEGGEVASSDQHPKEGGARHADVEGERATNTGTPEGASAKTEYPPQMHAGTFLDAIAMFWGRLGTDLP